MDVAILVLSQVLLIVISYGAGFYMAHLANRPKQRPEPRYLGRKPAVGETPDNGNTSPR